jgi:hypothetical protein
MPDSPIHALDDWASKLHLKLIEAVGHSTNEEELRLHVHQTILDAMHALHEISYRGATAERSPEKASQKSYDNLYGGVCVEWEWDMRTAMNRPGFPGGSKPWKGWSHGQEAPVIEEVPA